MNIGMFGSNTQLDLFCYHTWAMLLHFSCQSHSYGPTPGAYPIPSDWGGVGSCILYSSLDAKYFTLFLFQSNYVKSPSKPIFFDLIVCT